MKKTDLKPGVVYYYEPRHGTASPAVLVDTALWRHTWSRYQDADSKRYAHETRRTKPAKSDSWFADWQVGYLIVTAPEGQPDVLKGLTLAADDLVDAEGRLIPDVLPEGCKLDVVDNRYLTGAYEARVAELAEEERRKRERWDAERRKQQERVERHNRIATAFNAVLGTPMKLADSWVGGHVSLTFEQAEQIVALLTKES